VAFSRTSGTARALRLALFKGENVSVSRLAVIPLVDHWDMLRRHLEKPPERRLELIGEINVGRLHKIGRDYQHPIELTVEPKPEDWNLAHAEIPQKISRGLANRIVDALKHHHPPK
jgi:hypothetical protein